MEVSDGIAHQSAHNPLHRGGRRRSNTGVALNDNDGAASFTYRSTGSRLIFNI